MKKRDMYLKHKIRIYKDDFSSKKFYYQVLSKKINKLNEYYDKSQARKNYLSYSTHGKVVEDHLDDSDELCNAHNTGILSSKSSAADMSSESEGLQDTLPRPLYNAGNGGDSN